ncbi:MAG: VOC family protein [Planctomycetota bacterium]|nr:MAG: VOC family protein [Planctomycetota bacterium]
MRASLGFTGGLTCSMQCRDLDKAIDWYSSILGFSLLYRIDDMGWCELRTPVACANLGLSQVESPDGKGGATLTFGVNDIAKARAELESKSVRFDGDTVTIPGMVSLATFFDPDGNALMLYQDLSERN